MAFFYAFLAERITCGDKACPALGCEAAPESATEQCLVYFIFHYWGLLRSPARGEPARHNMSAFYSTLARLYNPITPRVLGLIQRLVRAQQ